MTVEIQTQKSCCSYLGEAFRSAKSEAKSIVRATASVVFSAMEYTEETLFDWGKGTDYTCQWIKYYSSCSTDVKETAGRVKGVADRFNLFGAVSELVVSGKNLVSQPMESFKGAVGAVLGHVAATTEVAGRLDDLKMVSLGAAQPYFGGVEAVALTALGAMGTRDAIASAETDSSVVSSVLKVAKNVTLAALGVLCGIASCFASVAAGMPQLPLYILTTVTLLLSLKIVDCFYDKLALPSPLEAAASSV